MLINTVFFHGLAAVAFGAVFFLTKDSIKAAAAAALVSAMAFALTLLKTPDKKVVFAVKNNPMNLKEAAEHYIRSLRMNLTSSAVLIASTMAIIFLRIWRYGVKLDVLITEILMLFFLFLVADVTKSAVKELVLLTAEPRRTFFLHLICHICVVFMVFWLIVICL